MTAVTNCIRCEGSGSAPTDKWGVHETCDCVNREVPSSYYIAVEVIDARLSRAENALSTIVESYTDRARLYANDAECAATMAYLAQAGLRRDGL